MLRDGNFEEAYECRFMCVICVQVLLDSHMGEMTPYSQVLTPHLYVIS